MSRQGPGLAFSTSPAKDSIRDVLDRNIIQRFKDDHYSSQMLNYLGLPGAAMLDVLSWREFIDTWTAVQVADTDEDIATLEELELNTLLNRMESGSHLVIGNVDDILRTADSRNQLNWPYHIVNLDYTGGLVHASGTDFRTSNRLDAIRGLFDRQIGIAFTLFLTLNLRNKDKGEITEFVNKQEADLSEQEELGVDTAFRDHRNLGYAGLLKIYTPIFLGSIANRHSLAFHAPILYQGTKQMIHFPVLCTPFTGFAAGRFLSQNDIINFINLPLLVTHDGTDLRQVELSKLSL